METNAFGVAKHLVGHHTRPTDRHTRSQHKGLRAARRRIEAEQYDRIERAEKKAEQKWRASDAGLADSVTRAFNDAMPEGRRADIPDNPAVNEARRKAREKAMRKPKYQKLSERRGRLQQAYRNQPTMLSEARAGVAKAFADPEADIAKSLL